MTTGAPAPLLFTKLYVPPGAAGRRRPFPPDRTARQGHAEQAHPRLRPGGLRQDHAGRRVGRRSRAAGRLAVAGREGQRPGAFPGLPRRRRADGRAGVGEGVAGRSPVAAAAAGRDDADGPAQRDRRRSPTTSSWSSTTTTWSTPSRSMRPSPSCSSTCRRGCIWSSPPAKTRACPWPGCAPGAS